MTLYRDMTPPELVETALDWHGANRATSRIIYALAKRLEQEYQRANSHRDKAIEVQRLRVEQEHRLASHIKVAKPHISICSSAGYGWGIGRDIWRCTGPFGAVQFGSSPTEAYAAWRKVMEQGHGIPRKPARFRFNYMRKA